MTDAANRPPKHQETRKPVATRIQAVVFLAVLGIGTVLGMFLGNIALGALLGLALGALLSTAVLNRAS